MRVIYYLQNKIRAVHVLMITFLALTSCGTYQQATYDDDGIYGSSQTRTRNTETVDTNTSNAYQDYFDSKSQEADDIYGDIFTDIDSYSSTGDVEQETEIENLGYSESYSPWGETTQDYTINVYTSNAGFFSPYRFGLWNRGFYGNRWWNGGFGWGFGGFGGFCDIYYPPYAGYWGQGFYSPFYGYAGFYGYRHPYYNYYRGRGYRNAVAYNRGRRAYYNRNAVGRNSNAYYRSNSRRANASRSRSYSSRRNTAVRSNRSNSRTVRSNSRTTRRNVRSTRSNSRPSVRSSSNTRRSNSRSYSSSRSSTRSSGRSYSSGRSSGRSSGGGRSSGRGGRRN